MTRLLKSTTNTNQQTTLRFFPNTLSVTVCGQATAVLFHTLVPMPRTRKGHSEPLRLCWRKTDNLKFSRSSTRARQRFEVFIRPKSAVDPQKRSREDPGISWSPLHWLPLGNSYTECLHAPDVCHWMNDTIVEIYTLCLPGKNLNKVEKKIFFRRWTLRTCVPITNRENITATFKKKREELLFTIAL